MRLVRIDDSAEQDYVFGWHAPDHTWAGGSDAQVLAGNRASLAVLDKLGMVNEGVKRQHVNKARRLHDVVLYGLLREEWSRR